mmetsp:Transcript_44753/g.140946  ORF Transcript_44753/g.140946 Transcript_44753/m.140946 type:complete len:90 (-) Transcript_44753:136-405(-)
MLCAVVIALAAFHGSAIHTSKVAPHMALDVPTSAPDRRCTYADLVPHKSAEQDKVSLGDGCELCGGMGGCPVCSTRAAPAGRRIFDLGS